MKLTFMYINSNNDMVAMPDHVICGVDHTVW